MHMVNVNLPGKSTVMAIDKVHSYLVTYMYNVEVRVVAASGLRVEGFNAEPLGFKSRYEVRLKVQYTFAHELNRDEKYIPTAHGHMLNTSVKKHIELVISLSMLGRSVFL